MKTKDLVITGLLTAIVYVSMSLLHVTISNSALHLGSLVIVVISLIFDRKQALFASSVGAALFDLSTEFAIYAPFTFVARLLLSLVVSFAKEKSILIQIIAATTGGIIVIAVYFISNILILGNFEASVAAAIPDVIQLALTILGVFIALPIKKAIKSL